MAARGTTRDISDELSTRGLLERQAKLKSALTTRFRNIVLGASVSVKDGATKEVAATRALQMQVETAAMIKACEDTLALTRHLKELWIFGSLRDLGEGEEPGTMVADARVTGELVELVLRRLRQVNVEQQQQQQQKQEQPLEAPAEVRPSE